MPILCDYEKASRIKNDMYVLKLCSIKPLFCGYEYIPQNSAQLIEHTNTFVNIMIVLGDFKAECWLLRSSVTSIKEKKHEKLLAG